MAGRGKLKAAADAAVALARPIMTVRRGSPGCTDMVRPHEDWAELAAQLGSRTASQYPVFSSGPQGERRLPLSHHGSPKGGNLRAIVLGLSTCGAARRRM